MCRIGIALAGLSFLVGPPPATNRDCKCADSKTVNGWCSKCGVGYVAAVKIKSKPLFDAIDTVKYGQSSIPTGKTESSSRSALD